MEKILEIIIGTVKVEINGLYVMIAGAIVAVVSVMGAIGSAKNDKSDMVWFCMRLLLWSVMVALSGAAFHNIDQPSAGIFCMFGVGILVAVHMAILSFREKEHKLNMVITLAIWVVFTHLFFTGHLSVYIAMGLMVIATVLLFSAPLIEDPDNETGVVKWGLRSVIYSLLVYLCGVALMNVDSSIGITLLIIASIFASIHLVFYQMVRLDYKEVAPALLSALIVTFSFFEYLGVTNLLDNLPI